MTPTPPSTTSSSVGGQSPDAQFRVVRKRNRVPLSCAPCRHRKLKCNRSHPCENCVRRGDAASCSYAAPPARKKNQSQGATSPDDMQSRIDRLEGLVLSLMTNGAQSAGPTAAADALNRTQSHSESAASSFYPPDAEQDDDDMVLEEDEDVESDVEGVTKSLGVLKVDKDRGKSMYIGESHWHLVLADIAEVKNYFTQHKKEFDKNYSQILESTKSKSGAGDGPPVLLSSPPLMSDMDLRSELPPKSSVDKLVTRYFNFHDPSVNILHSPTFHQQLLDHWKDPSKTSIIWLGMLYGVLSLAMRSYYMMGDEPMELKGRTTELAREYRLRTVQCLINSDYTKPSNYTLETLLIYVNCEYAATSEAEATLYMMAGIIVRLGFRMGYHRDLPNLTPFQAEMRRRVWAFIRLMDILLSFQLALPSMIRSSDCDAQLPRNIFEDEFGPDSKVLPPERPITEPTPMSYTIAKCEVALEFEVIVEMVGSVNSKSLTYDDIMQHDNKLRELRNNMFPHLRLRPMDECTHDPAILLSHRYNLDILWQKSMCVLHRKFLVRARHNSRYTHSRRACVDAAMEILSHQAKLHRESQPGGRMRTMKWFVTSLIKADYLLAAMIVCLDQYYDTVAESSDERPADFDPYFWTPDRRADMLQSLETSYLIWREVSQESGDAYKASFLLGMMVEKLKSLKSKIPSQQPAPLAQPSAEAFSQFDSSKPEQSAAMSLGMLSGGLSPNTAALFGSMDIKIGESSASTAMSPSFSMDPQPPLGAIPFSVFNTSAEGAGSTDALSNLDWEAWDTYIQGGDNLDSTFQFYPPAMDASSPEIIDAQQQQATNPSLFGSFPPNPSPGREGSL